MSWKYFSRWQQGHDTASRWRTPRTWLTWPKELTSPTALAAHGVRHARGARGADGARGGPTWRLLSQGVGALLLLGVATGCFFTSDNLAGGTTDSGNALVLGKVTYAGGEVANARIRIRPADYVVGDSLEAGGRADTTSDVNGKFAVRIATDRDYGLEILRGDSLAYWAILHASALASGEVDLDSVPLQATAKLSGSFASSGTASGTVKLRGLEAQTEIQSDGSFAFATLPAGNHQVVCAFSNKPILEIPDVQTVASKTTVIEHIDADKATWDLIKPNSFVADSLAVDAYLIAQGIRDNFDFAARTRTVDGRLRTLLLDSLGIVELHPSIGSLDFLFTLNLAHNQLKHLPAALGKAWRLSTLNAEDNALIDVPSEIGSLTFLEFLKLSQNQLSSLPTEIFNLSHLRKLAIAENRFTVLSPLIGQLTHLEMLDLYGNNFTTLPEELGSLTALQQLWANNMGLTVLPTGFTRLAALEILQLNANALTALPEDLGHLTHLRSLSVYGNALESLPSSIENLPNLQTLEIGKNRLCLVHDSLATWLDDKVGSGWKSSQTNCP